jgi:chemotaxis protein methyltransferase CheR
LATIVPHADGTHQPSTLDWDRSGFSITPELFRNFQQLIHEESGIWLGDSKVALLCGRLSRRLRALGISTLEQYYKLVVEPEQGKERVLMIDAITTNETRFFREFKQFEFLERRVIPRWKANVDQGSRPRTISLWSAACSSGEEPYSLAMLMSGHAPASDGWDVSILATDISTRMLDRARAGVYGIEKAVDIPEPLLKEHMLRGIADERGHMKVMPHIQSMVEFRKLNLMQDPYPSEASFDAIFCRNVLIYFDLASKSKVVERLVRCLRPQGLLFLGQAENLSGVSSQFRSLVPAVYIRTGEQNAF